MKLLITGNCGFIGQNFVRLFKNKYNIVGIDKLGYASDKKVLNLCKTYISDISNYEDTEDIILKEKPDIIINFAAESHVDNSILSPKLFMYSNYIGVFNLLEIVKKNNIKKIIQISTDEVMGDLQPNDPPFSNEFLLKPSSPYSASKAAADMLIMAYNRTYKINTIITRTCNNYGPFQYKEKFIPVVIRNILNNKKIPIYGVGQNIREWIHVEDNCKAIEFLINNGENSKIYNIGSNYEISNLDLVKKILKMMNKSNDLISFTQDRKGHDLRYAIDSSIIRDMGWKDNIQINEGLIKTIKWYKDNINYWE